MCKDANPEVVRYALNRSVSPTMVSKYEEQLKVGSVIQRSLEEFVDFLDKRCCAAFVAPRVRVLGHARVP